MGGPRAPNPHGIAPWCRMTVVRLRNRQLLLHSPIPIDADMKAEIEGLGEVTHIVSPNLYHHLYAGEAQKAWPDALLHGPEKIHRKRSDLKFNGIFHEDSPHSHWEGLRLVIKPLLPLVLSAPQILN